MKIQIISFFVVLLSFQSCQEPKAEVQEKPIETFFSKNQKAFQKKIDNKQIDLFLLKNKTGMEATITNYGARVVSLTAPDRNGNMKDIVAGFSSLQGYLFANEKYFGATIGRYGNRIANGEFSLDDQAYRLAKNNGDNHLHGGIKGFHAIPWDAKQVDDQTIELKHFSKDKEEGYPGNLNITLTYHLSDQNELQINYSANTDKKTVVNLTHHSFFNLAGEGNPSILNHELQINASRYTPVNKGLIPTGELASVQDTPFDFNSPTKIGARIKTDHEQIQFGLGYDHNYVLDRNDPEVIQAATVYEPTSGRVMEIYTNEPGLQFYSGNFLSGRDKGKSGKPYPFRSSFCLETQHFPDSPNQVGFPSTVLNPGETYRSYCGYRFSVR